MWLTVLRASLQFLRIHILMHSEASIFLLPRRNNINNNNNNNKWLYSAFSWSRAVDLSCGLQLSSRLPSAALPVSPCWVLLRQRWSPQTHSIYVSFIFAMSPKCRQLVQKHEQFCFFLIWIATISLPLNHHGPSHSVLLAGWQWDAPSFASVWSACRKCWAPKVQGCWENVREIQGPISLHEGTALQGEK